MGKPYVEYQNGPQSYSPLGLILASLHSVGLNFSGNYSQISRLGKSVSLEEAQPGDIALFCIDVCGKPCHGGIFIGRDIFAHVDTK